MVKPFGQEASVSDLRWTGLCFDVPATSCRGNQLRGGFFGLAGARLGRNDVSSKPGRQQDLAFDESLHIAGIAIARPVDRRHRSGEIGDLGRIYLCRAIRGRNGKIVKNAFGRRPAEQARADLEPSARTTAGPAKQPIHRQFFGMA